MRQSLAIALSLVASIAAAQPRLVETSHLTISAADENFGGLSGLELNEDGTEGWIISDRGHIASIEMTRDETGDLLGVTFGDFFELHRPYRDLPLMNRKDTEGLAVLPSGRIAISMEHPSRIWLFETPTAVPDLTYPHFDFGIIMESTGLEALAVDPEGRLVTIPERPLERGDRIFPVFRIEDGEWKWVQNLPRSGAFLPVGADFGPDGHLYLLERAASLLGFRSRVRRFDAADPNPTPQVLFESDVGAFDNLEAITLWVDPAGVTRVTLVSDDNFLSIQRSEIVEFKLSE